MTTLRERTSSSSSSNTRGSFLTQPFGRTYDTCTYKKVLSFSVTAKTLKLKSLLPSTKEERWIQFRERDGEKSVILVLIGLKKPLGNSERGRLQCSL